MLDVVFNRMFEQFLDEQKKMADPKQAEMLDRDLTGTKALLRNVVYPTLGNLEGLILEHRIVNSAGVSLYIDVYFAPLRLGLECEGFSAHAETITRERFSMEKSKVRTMLEQGIFYIPFSKDDIDKRSEACRQSLENILFFWKHRSITDQLTVYEREALRYALHAAKPIKLSDVRKHLGKSRKLCVKVIHGLIAKSLLKPFDETKKRHHFYIIREQYSPIKEHYTPPIKGH